MRLRTRIRDCLYVNWAIPVAPLRPAPNPLRYERHSHEGQDYVIASALLFHHEGLHLDSFPVVKLSFPQFNLRLYVVDDEGMPAVLFVRMLVPAWVTPAVRLIARQPARTARFEQGGGDDDGWRWRVRRRSHFACTATPGIPTAPPTLFSSWEETVDSVRLRNRGYFLDHGHLHRIDTENHPIEAVPVRAEITDDTLVADALRVGEMPELHSAWLCPEMPLVFELAGNAALAIPRRVPATG
ncbi:MAG: DUF2071 domain-containing protein [Acidobacteriota bacterium]|nr:DUF2071 domain-containing protein [Acidobacteriota bacterium]